MKRALRAAVAAGMFLAAIPFVMTVAMQANAPTASKPLAERSPSTPRAGSRG
jgi:hypothetical protein